MFLDETLQSVWRQTYHDWECLIIDDGSTDDTEKIADGWNKKDTRFKYFYQQNTGLSSARNKGLNIATGEYIQFLDADDVLDTNKLSASMILAGKADVIMSNFRMFPNDI